MISLFILFCCAVVALTALFSGDFWISLAVIILTCGIIYFTIRLLNKASSPSKEKLIIVVAVLLGVAMVIGGFFNCIDDGKPTSYSISSTQCGYCGGSGRISSGKICPLCDGLGGAYRKEAKVGNDLWLGMLLIDAGIAVWVSIIAKQMDV